MAQSREIASISLDWLEEKSFDVYVESLTEVLQRLSNENMKVKRDHKRVVPWWSPSLTIERKGVQVTRRRFERCVND